MSSQNPKNPLWEKVSQYLTPDASSKPESDNVLMAKTTRYLERAKDGDQSMWNGRLVTVTKAKDGDTFEIQDDEGFTDTVRLDYGNTPELGTEGGQWAKQASQEHLIGKKVIVQTSTGTKGTRDRYGRLLADLRLATDPKFVRALQGDHDTLSESMQPAEEPSMSEWISDPANIDKSKPWYQNLYHSLKTSAARMRFNIEGLTVMAAELAGVNDVHAQNRMWNAAYELDRLSRLSNFEPLDEQSEASQFWWNTKQALAHPSRGLGVLIESAPQMAATALGSILAGPIGAVGGAMLSSEGEDYATARLQGVSPDKAAAATLPVSAMKGAVEAVAVGRILSANKVLVRGLAGHLAGKTLAEKAASELTEQAVQSTYQSILRSPTVQFLAHTVGDYATGASEEVTQLFLDNARDRVLGLHKGPLSQGAGQAAALGGLMEATAAAPGRGVNLGLQWQQTKTNDFQKSIHQAATGEEAIAFNLINDIRTKVRRGIRAGIWLNPSQKAELFDYLDSIETKLKQRDYYTPEKAAQAAPATAPTQETPAPEQETPTQTDPIREAVETEKADNPTPAEAAEYAAEEEYRMAMEARPTDEDYAAEANRASAVVSGQAAGVINTETGEVTTQGSPAQQATTQGQEDTDPAFTRKYGVTVDQAVKNYESLIEKTTDFMALSRSIYQVFTRDFQYPDIAKALNDKLWTNKRNLDYQAASKSTVILEDQEAGDALTAALTQLADAWDEEHSAAEPTATEIQQIRQFYDQVYALLDSKQPGKTKKVRKNIKKAELLQVIDAMLNDIYAIDHPEIKENFEQYNLKRHTLLDNQDAAREAIVNLKRDIASLQDQIQGKMPKTDALSALQHTLSQKQKEINRRTAEALKLGKALEKWPAIHWDSIVRNLRNKDQSGANTAEALIELETGEARSVEDTDDDADIKPSSRREWLPAVQIETHNLYVHRSFESVPLPTLMHRAWYDLGKQALDHEKLERLVQQAELADQQSPQQDMDQAEAVMWGFIDATRLRENKIADATILNKLAGSRRPGTLLDRFLKGDNDVKEFVHQHRNQMVADRNGTRYYFSTDPNAANQQTRYKIRKTEPFDTLSTEAAHDHITSPIEHPETPPAPLARSKKGKLLIPVKDGTFSYKENASTADLMRALDAPNITDRDRKEINQTLQGRPEYRELDSDIFGPVAGDQGVSVNTAEMDQAVLDEGFKHNTGQPNKWEQYHEDPERVLQDKARQARQPINGAHHARVFGMYSDYLARQLKQAGIEPTQDRVAAGQEAIKVLYDTLRQRAIVRGVTPEFAQEVANNTIKAWIKAALPFIHPDVWAKTYTLGAQGGQLDTATAARLRKKRSTPELFMKRYRQAYQQTFDRRREIADQEAVKYISMAEAAKVAQAKQAPVTEKPDAVVNAAGQAVAAAPVDTGPLEVEVIAPNTAVVVRSQTDTGPQIGQARRVYSQEYANTPPPSQPPVETAPESSPEAQLSLPPGDIVPEFNWKEFLADVETVMAKAFGAAKAPAKTRALLNPFFMDRVDGQIRVERAKLLSECQSLQRQIADLLGIKKYDPSQVGAIYKGYTLKEVSMALILAQDLRQYQEAHQYAHQLNPTQKRIYGLASQIDTNPDHATLRQALQVIDEIGQRHGKLAQAWGMISGTASHHITHFWDLERSDLRRAERAFITSPTASKSRTLENGIMQGWANGMVLETEDVTRAIYKSFDGILEGKRNRDLVKTAVALGIFTTQSNIPGFVRIDHPQIYAAKEQQAYYAPKKVAAQLNALFGKSHLRTMPVIKQLLAVNAFLKKTLLLASLFHLRAFHRQFLLGTRGLHVNPLSAVKAGQVAIAELGPELQELLIGGLVLDMAADFDVSYDQTPSMTDRYFESSDTLTASAYKTFKRWKQTYERYLFQTTGPALKALGALTEYRHQLAKYSAELDAGTADKASIARAVASRYNHDFGGLNTVRMGFSPTAQDMARFLFLGHDWTISNTLAAVNAIKSGHEGQVHRALWAQVAVHAAVPWLAFNMLMAGLDDEKDFTGLLKQGWQDGKLMFLDVNVTPIYKLLGGKRNDRVYWSMLGQFKDPFAWLNSWSSAIFSKGSREQSIREGIGPYRYKSGALMSSVLDALLGQDHTGAAYNTWDQLWQTGALTSWVAPADTDRKSMGPITYSQMPAFAIDQLKSFLPTQLSSTIDFITGQANGLATLMAMAGVKAKVKYNRND